MAVDEHCSWLCILAAQQARRADTAVSQSAVRDARRSPQLQGQASCSGRRPHLVISYVLSPLLVSHDDRLLSSGLSGPSLKGTLFNLSASACGWPMPGAESRRRARVCAAAAARLSSLVPPPSPPAPIRPPLSSSFTCSSFLHPRPAMSLPPCVQRFKAVCPFLSQTKNSQLRSFASTPSPLSPAFSRLTAQAVGCPVMGPALEQVRSPPLDPLLFSAKAVVLGGAGGRSVELARADARSAACHWTSIALPTTKPPSSLDAPSSSSRSSLDHLSLLASTPADARQARADHAFPFLSSSIVPAVVFLPPLSLVASDAFVPHPRPTADLCPLARRARSLPAARRAATHLSSSRPRPSSRR